MERNDELIKTNKMQVEKAQFSAYKKAQLVSMLEEQHSTLAAMKRVLYTETNELRDRLMVLNTENSFLKETLAQKTREAALNLHQEADMREKLRPIVEKLQSKHSLEMEALRLEYRSLQARLLTTESALNEMRAKSGALLARKSAAEAALNSLKKEHEKLLNELENEANLYKAIKTLEFSPNEGELSKEELYSKLYEYKAALRAAGKQNAAAEETIQTLNIALKESQAFLENLRIKHAEHLLALRERVLQLEALFEAPVAKEPSQSCIKQFPINGKP